MSKVFKRIQRNVHIEGERERRRELERERERGALIGGDRLTKGTLDTGLLWTFLADSTKGGQVNRIFKLSGAAPTPALVPASLLLSHVSLSVSLLTGYFPLLPQWTRFRLLCGCDLRFVWTKPRRAQVPHFERGEKEKRMQRKETGQGKH